MMEKYVTKDLSLNQYRIKVISKFSIKFEAKAQNNTGYFMNFRIKKLRLFAYFIVAL